MPERGNCYVQAELHAGYPSTVKPGPISACLGPLYPRSLTAELSVALAAFVAEELDLGPSIYMLVSFVEEWCDDHQDAMAAAAAAITAAPRESAGAKAGGGSGGGDGGGSCGTGVAIGETELLLERQWIWFIGFYTKSIIKAFCSTAAEHGCTGFLMPGKPAVAAGTNACDMHVCIRGFPYRLHPRV